MNNSRVSSVTMSGSKPNIHGDRNHTTSQGSLYLPTKSLFCGMACIDNLQNAILFNTLVLHHTSFRAKLNLKSKSILVKNWF